MQNKLNSLASPQTCTFLCHKYTLNAALWFLYGKPNQNTQSFIHYYVKVVFSIFMLNTNDNDRDTSTVI